MVGFKRGPGDSFCKFDEEFYSSTVDSLGESIVVLDGEEDKQAIEAAIAGRVKADGSFIY